MSGEDYNPNEFQEFDEPLFPEDADIVPPEPAGAPQAPRNRRFIIIALLLVLVFLIALGVGASAIVEQDRQRKIYEGTRDAVYATNTAVQIALFATQTAKAWTPTPTATFTPTYTPTPTATLTETPTATLTATATIDLAGTQTAEALTQTAVALIGATNATSTAIAQQTIDAALTMTASALATTEIPGTPGTPGELSGADQTATVLALTPGLTVSPTVSPTATPVTGTPPTKTVNAQTATKLAETGFFDDMGFGAKGGVGSLGIVGLAALALVGVIVMARVLRAKT